jgi:hypothetical protein
VNENLKKIIFGAMLTIGLFWTLDYAINFEIELSELKEVKGILKKSPKFDIVRGAGRYIELVISEDDYRYHTNGIGYDALKINELKKDFKIGQSVTFLVSKGTGIEELLDGLFGVVDFYGLKSNGKTYLNLQDYNKGRRGNRYTCIIIWFFFFGFYIYNFWIKVNKLRTDK